MIENKKIIAIIPARGGSKRVPRKNVKLLADKPLIAYAIEAALKSKYLDRVIVSTEDDEIATIAKEFGAEIPFVRPMEIATDAAKSLDVLQHAVRFLEEKENFKPELTVLIQPTSPLVLTEDIDKTIEKSLKTNSNSCTTFCEITERPEWMYIMENDRAKLFMEQKTQETRTQYLPKIFRLNGAVYVIKYDTLMIANKILDNSNLSAVIMPEERSIDIGKPFDFEVAEALLKYNNERKNHENN